MLSISTQIQQFKNVGEMIHYKVRGTEMLADAKCSHERKIPGYLHKCFRTFRQLAYMD